MIIQYCPSDFHSPYNILDILLGRGSFSFTCLFYCLIRRLAYSLYTVHVGWNDSWQYCFMTVIKLFNIFCPIEVENRTVGIRGWGEGGKVRMRLVDWFLKSELSTVFISVDLHIYLSHWITYPQSDFKSQSKAFHFSELTLKLEQT